MGTRWQVSSGESINILADKWVPGLPNFKIQTSAPTNTILRSVNELIIPDRSQWNTRLIRDLFNDQEANAIEEIPLKMLGGIDKVIWHFERKGQYSIKLGYRRLKAIDMNNPLGIINNSSSGSKQWKSIWKLRVQPKLRFFI